MPTAKQQVLVDAIKRVMENDVRIEAAWLAGSLGRGQGDQWSDVDVLALVQDGDPARVATSYVQEAQAIAKLALVTPLPVGWIVNFVTADWQRFDLSFVRKANLDGFDANALTLLFNKGTHEPPRRVAPGPYRPSADQLARPFNEFLRVLGLASVVVGRQEYVVALSGVEKLRDMLIELMLAENGIGRAQRGGALHLNSLLTDDQHMALQALPPALATREAVMALHQEIAGLFLPRAQRVARDAGIEWPQAFEAATRRHLLTSLDLQV